MTAAVITGLGAVSALGRGVARIWSAMAEGHDGIAPIRRFDPAGWGVPLAGMVPDRNAPADGAAPMWRHCVEYAIAAAREAWATADVQGVAPARVALVLGSSLGDPTVPLHRMTEEVGDALGVAGPRLTVSTACASSANALGLALDLLATDTADVVIAGGADVLTPLVLAGFTALGVLATGKCAPFSEPPGTTLGEGAGFAVLERPGRRAAPLVLLGYGLSADGFHDTGPDPTGAGVARAIRAALDHAGVTATAIDYVNAHGTGTRANDPAEWRALQQVFGRRAEALPVSSSKSFLGHAQGAAGVLETIATLVAMEHGAIPPTQRYTAPRPHSPPDAVGQATARPARCDVAVSTSSAFGGANCAVVVGRRAPAVARTVRPVYLAGVGAIGPHGTALDRLGAAPVRGRVTDFRFAAAVPAVDPRGLDACTQYLTAATALALGDAGVRLRGEARERSGLVVGVTVASPAAEAALTATIDAHGYGGLSASLFSRMVLNAPGGTCAKVHGLRGAHSTLSTGAGSGLVAIAYAAELLATRREVDRMVGAGVDELAAGAGDQASEGAAAVVLTAAPTALRVAAWQLAGPGLLDPGAVLARAGLTAVDLIVGPGAALDPVERLGDSPAFTAAAGVVLAALALRTGAARHVLVLHRGGASADAAVVLIREELHAG